MYVTHNWFIVKEYLPKKREKKKMFNSIITHISHIYA